MKHRIVYPSNHGPAFYEYNSFEDMAACMLAWVTAGVGLTLYRASAWKFKYGKWVPAFGYHPGGSVDQVAP